MIDNRLYKKKITSYCNEKGWSLCELSLQANISMATIYSWFKNEKSPSLKNIQKICIALNITLCDFFS